jgi:hypothetical protein
LCRIATAQALTSTWSPARLELLILQTAKRRRSESSYGAERSDHSLAPGALAERVRRRRLVHHPARLRPGAKHVERRRRHGVPGVLVRGRCERVERVVRRLLLRYAPGADVHDGAAAELVAVEAR